MREPRPGTLNNVAFALVHVTILGVRRGPRPAAARPRARRDRASAAVPLRRVA